MHRRRVLLVGFLVLVLPHSAVADSPPRPNILVCMADDWGWPSSPLYGDMAAVTPAFERLARDGVLFHRAYCSVPSCTPSRASFLSGQDFFRLKETSCLWGEFPKRLPIYTDLLAEQGYALGLASKGWGPGSFAASGRKHNPAGPVVGDFGAFVRSLPDDKSFCFWLGSQDPHRPYRKDSGVKAGFDPDRVIVPKFLPDEPVVRRDLCDYLAEVARFDAEVGQAIKVLEETGRYDNTLIIMTGDNGMPFPRCKMNLYDWGVRQPLVIAWKARIPTGRSCDDFVSLIDIAPTILDAVGVPLPDEMTGRSLLPMLLSTASGVLDQTRDSVVTGREWHGVSYPMRSIRTRRYSYIRNYRPDVRPLFADDGPTKQRILERPSTDNCSQYEDLCFGLRPAEELYDLDADPYEISNKASDPAYATILETMRKRLDDYLVARQDPRALGDTSFFDSFVPIRRKR